MDITQIPGLTGWPGTLLTLVGIVIYGFYIKRSAKSKAEDLAKDAYDKAIKAMQIRADIQDKRLNDAEKENTRLQQTVETIYSALEARGIYITVQGRMVHIQDSKGGTTTIQISGEKEAD